MATTCIDISADKNISNASPFSMIAFMILYIITNILMSASFLFIILVIVEFIVCQILFQFSPRVVFLMLDFITQHTHLSPTREDLRYYPQEKDIENLKNLIIK